VQEEIDDGDARVGVAVVVVVLKHFREPLDDDVGDLGPMW
jgi:hypothetical protein